MTKEHKHKTTTVEECNELMQRLIPELEHSRLVAIPMVLGRWYHPEENLDDGTPCFIASNEQDYGIYHPDYIWMPKRTTEGEEAQLLPAGYYHLRTRESYLEINARLEEVGPDPSWCGCLPKSTSSSLLQGHRDKVAFKEVKHLMKLRLESGIPNDEYILRLHHMNPLTLSRHVQIRPWVGSPLLQMT